MYRQEYVSAPVRRVVPFGLVLAIVGGLFTIGSGALAQPGPPTLHDLRVCGATTFSRELQECTSDESASVLVSNRITCSIEVDLTVAADLDSWMTYDAARIAFPSVRLEPGSYPRWINESLKIDRPLPGGAWTCGFTLAGSTLTASFRTEGPVGDVVNTAACRYSTTIRYGSGRVCRSDESAAPIQRTNAVACYATYPNASGKLARLTILRAGGVIQATSFRPSGPLNWAWVWTKAPPGKTLPGGKYACNYWLAGKLAASKPFRLRQ